MSSSKNSTNNEEKPPLYRNEQKYRVTYDANKIDQASIQPATIIAHAATKADPDYERGIYVAKENGRKVFIKKITPTGSKKRLQAWRELMICQELNHPNIAKIHDAIVLLDKDDDGKLNKAQFTSNDYGTTFPTGEAKGAGMSFQLWLSVAAGILHGLAYMKKMGVMHRDIKPENIAVDDVTREGKAKVRIIDFGAARVAKKGNFTKNAGTSANATPEVKLGHSNYSFGIDVYGAGISLLDILKNRGVFFRSFMNEVKSLGIRKVGNPFSDELLAPSFFAYLCDEFGLTDKERENITRPDQNVDYSNSFNQEKVNQFKAKHTSISQYIINGWMSHLTEDDGWTNENKALAVDCVLKMINYVPDKRQSPEELLEHGIFSHLENHEAKPAYDSPVGKKAELGQDDAFESFGQALGEQGFSFQMSGAEHKIENNDNYFVMKIDPKTVRRVVQTSDGPKDVRQVYQDIAQNKKTYDIKETDQEDQEEEVRKDEESGGYKMHTNNVCDSLGPNAYDDFADFMGGNINYDNDSGSGGQSNLDMQGWGQN